MENEADWHLLLKVERDKFFSALAINDFTQAIRSRHLIDALEQYGSKRGWIAKP